MRGSGKVKNLPAEWELVLLEGGPKPFLLVEIASGSLEKHRPVLDQLASSFKVSEGVSLPVVATATPVASETPVALETSMAAETPAAEETPEE